MFKGALKRFTSLLIVAVMVFAMIPAASIPVFAANVDTGVDGLTADSSGNATWRSSNGTITGSVTASSSSGCTGTTYTARNGTLTFTNNSGSTALISFDYSLELNGGSATVDGTNVTAGASFSKKINANEPVVVSITSPKGDGTTSIVISNLMLTLEQPVDITFKAPTNGSYTFNGNAITTDTVETVLTTDSITLAAIPASGYKFSGWYSETDEEYFSIITPLTTSFTAAKTVYPVFVESSSPVFQVGKQLFKDLNEATTYAVSSGTAKIVLISDGTLPAGDYNIPNGKTLLIPFDDAQTVYTTSPGMTTKADGSPAAHVNPSAFRTLTMADGANIKIASGAVLSVPSMLSAVGTNTGSWNATPTGKHGRITMNAGSSIDVQSGGKLYAYGYIAGSGDVYARSGSEIWECFQIRSWRGGTCISSMAGNSLKVFPLNQYYVQNIEAPLTLYAGATEKVFAAVNASSQQFGASATFVGNGGMFEINDGSVTNGSVTNGSVTKRYIGNTDRLELSVNGDFNINAMSLRITGLPMIGTLDLNTADYVLPIQSNITINVNSGTTTIGQDVAFLPGSEVNIADGAELKVKNGFKTYVYDKDQWGAYAYAGGQLIVVGYSTVNGTTTKRTAASLVDAKIDVNGTLTVAGQLYTTESGAAIVSSAGTGKVVLQADPGTDTNTYMATVSGSSPTYVSIPITPAKLQNADGSYCETADKPADTEIPYANGYWGGTAPTYTVIWKNEDGTELEKDENVPYGTMPTYDSEEPTKAATAQYSYTFAGWTPEVTAVTGSVTYTAKYNRTVNEYTITWVDGDGNTLKTEQVAYGETPSYTGDTPTKTATAQYTYTFNNTWSPAITSVTKDATYTAQFDSTVNEYTITFVNEDGTELQSGKVAYGTTPVYNGETPTKAATAQYTYTFTGWDPAITEVTGDATYTAQFSSTVNEYTITFVNEDGTVLQSGEVAYGTTPAYTGATPTKEATAQYTYTFTGWDPAIAEVTGDATYTAQFSRTVNTYTVTWVIDGVEETETYEYGETPAHADPTKEADAQYTYTFTGWDPAIAEVTGDVTYTAQFSTTLRKYTVTWKNYDGEILETDENVPYGTTPSYDGDDPAKTHTAQYEFTFAGWDPEITAVTGDAEYTAVFSQQTRKYWIYFVNEDGTDLQVSEFEYGTMPVYGGETPTKTGDAQYGYTFTGWTPAIGIVTGSKTYTAVFEQYTNKYEIKFVDEDGTVLQTGEVKYGVMPVYEGENPTKEATAQYTYTFAGWSPALHKVTGAETYTATYTATVNTYMIIFVNYDGEVLQRGRVAYGEMPVYSGETPAKPGDVQHNYTFAGWDPEITTVTGSATYTALFTEGTNVYTIKFVNYDGTVLQNRKVAYGETPTYDGATPTKEADAQYTYTFSGWDPEIAEVTGDATYTAQFSSTVNKYTVTWVIDGAEETEEYEYGATPEHVDPIKEADAQYTYTFTGWTPEITEVTGNATYTAQFSSTVNKYTVTWIIDGVEVTEEYEYGATPAYNGEMPHKAPDEANVYVFAGWDPEITTVTGNATYTAVFEAETAVWTGPEWSWTDITENGFDATAKATATFTYGTETISKSVNVTGELVKIDGKDTTYAYRYTASIEFNGQTYTDEYSREFEAVTLIGQTPTLNGVLSINFRFQAPENAETVKFVYEFNDTVVELRLAKDGPYFITESNSERFKVPFTNIQSACITKNVTMKVYDADGNEIPMIRLDKNFYGTEFSYCMADWAKSMLDNPEKPEETKQLARAILNYGYYASEYFGEKNGNAEKYSFNYEKYGEYLDLDMVENVTADPANDAIGADEAKANTSYKGALITLEGSTTLRLYFDSTKAMPVVKNAAGKAYTVYQNDIGYYVEVSGIGSGNLNRKYTFVITGEDGNDYTVKYSVLSWANSMINRGNGANNEYVKTVNLAKALYQYWAAADAYFAIH